ncbi:MAG: glycosyltransferase family 4 protein [Gelidibacter sp.]
MSKVILISQQPLPYHHIGSWTTMYKNYFESGNSGIDTILCEAPLKQFNGVDYCIVPTNFISKVKQKLTKKPHQLYVETLIKYLQPNEKYIVQIIDNFGLVKALKAYLTDHPNIRKQLYIQFFYHGYPPFFGNFESRWFFEFIDEMVLLTHSAYIAHKNAYTILPCLFSVLHNGINTAKFHPPTPEKKIALKKKHQVTDKTVFVWCSQDRPKKGLDLILNVWKLLIERHKNIELWVVGATRDLEQTGVKFFGKMPNDLLPEYYQTSDCYLFPTLWHEGFGLTLIEALHCGNYCIASALGGVPEVLQDGKLGVLIEHPHFIEEWELAITTFLKNKEINKPKEIDRYTMEEWNLGMNKIINKAKSLMV